MSHGAVEQRQHEGERSERGWLSAELSDGEFATLSDFIHDHCGIRYPPAKRLALDIRLRKRLRALNLETFGEYLPRVLGASASAEEVVLMIDQITTNKTDFFRESTHFDYLIHEALPRLVRSGASTRGHGLSLWSAACSSGEEVYTLAMVLENASERGPRLRYSVLGTDISTAVLAEARRAIYDAKLIEPVPDEMRRRYLLQSRARDRDLVRIAPVLRRKVRFSRLNLLAPYTLRGHPHVIFCRNVLIYFDRAPQRQVLDRLCRQLAPGGYLFLGHSDSISGLKLPVSQLMPSVYHKAAVA